MEFVAEAEFIRRTMGGRPNQMDTSAYSGAVFECACGAAHRFERSSIEVLRELSKMRLVLNCPSRRGVVCVKVKGMVAFKGFETLFGCKQEVVSAAEPERSQQSDALVPADQPRDGLVVSFEELEAMHDVIEAARCHWHQQPTFHDRAAAALQRANQFFWRVGEVAEKVGSPSARFQPVVHSSAGDTVERLLATIDDIAREYSRTNDPWFADTITVSYAFAQTLDADELNRLAESLSRLGLALTTDADLSPREVHATRSDHGPWIISGLDPSQYK